MRLFCYYFVTLIRWSNKTNSYICIGNKIRTLEKPRDFDPFGHAGLSPLVTI